MKLKRVIALACALLLCLGLCGCDPDLDALRKTHGNYTADRDILLDGVLYKQVTYPLLNPTCIYGYEGNIFVAEEGVPLLVTMMEYDDTLYPSVDEKFLCPMWYEGDTFYVREDVYDEVTAQIEAEPTLDTYRYLTYDEYWTTKAFTLTAEQAAMLRTIWSEAEWEIGGGNGVLDDPNYEQLEVVPCSTNGWFADEDALFRVYWVPGKSSYMLSSTGSNLVAHVPLEYVTEFEKILQPAIDYAEARMEKGTMQPEYSW